MPGLLHPIYHDPTIGLEVVARPGRDGIWLVDFTRRSRMQKQLDQCAAWLPSGHWDERRWHPIGARLVPPKVREQVEQWLRDHSASTSGV